MVELARHFQDKGFERILLFLDNNATHKQKMQHLFLHLAQQANLTIQIVFQFIAPYSPKLNLVEYAIHLIRQEVLHHADYRKSLEDFVSQVKELCKDQKLLSKEQIINILCHIQGLVPRF